MAAPGVPTPPPMTPLPPLNLNQSATSSAKAGDLSSSMFQDHSGFSVNFGNGVVQGGGGAGGTINPQYLLIAAIVGIVLWKKKLI
jgi:hypothetical protein